MSRIAASPAALAKPRTDRPTARRARLGASGFLFVFVTVFLAIGAVNSQNNLLFWIFGLAVAAVIVSGLLSGNSLMGVRLEAGDVLDTAVGESRGIPYQVRSRNRLLPAFAMVIREDPAGDSDPACLLHLGPMGVRRISTVWTPQRRGTHTFDRIVLESRFPFGFIIKSLEFSRPRSALALPPVIELRSDLLSAAGTGQSEHRIKRARRGVTGSYFGLRAYTPGDSRRSIAWRPSARRSELLVVEHAEPQGRSVWIHLERPPESGGSAELTERAIALANAVFRTASRAGRTVAIWAPWAGVRMTPSRGSGAELRAARALAVIDAERPGGVDGPPPMRPGDALISVPCAACGGSTADRLDPDRPADWLAPETTMHHSLGPRGGAR